MMWQAVVIALVFAQAADSPFTVLDRYVSALGGGEALRRVHSRITEGTFDNGRGLNTRFRIYEQAPDKRAIIIGGRPIESPDGSGRGYDGAAGWDKNFIGAGLRMVDGQELADLARDADLLRPLHLGGRCSSLAREDSRNSDDILRCEFSGGRAVRLFFDRSSGLLTRQESGPSASVVTTQFENYRSVDGVQIPFRTRIRVPGATIIYSAERVRQNAPIDERMFRRPDR